MDCGSRFDLTIIFDEDLSILEMLEKLKTFGLKPEFFTGSADKPDVLFLHTKKEEKEDE